MTEAQPAGPVATVLVPRSLMALFPDLPRRCEATGRTVDELIDDLDRRVPGFRDRLCEGRSLRRYINVFVAGDKASITTPVGEGDLIHIVPAVAGGAA